MKRAFVISLAVFTLLTTNSCKKQSVTLQSNANEIFWLSINGSDMPVWVKGNTLSNVFIVLIHGGPGEGAYDYTPIVGGLQSNYAVVYWDQRNAGGSAGNSNINKLSMDQMVSDMDDLIKVLKYRYGRPDIFLLAHSFGGLLTSAYLTKDTNQNKIRGWIDLDGAHNYPLCNSSSRQMLLDSGFVQVNKGNNVLKWNQIISYCSTHDPNASYDASVQTENYAHDAESLMGAGTTSQGSVIFTPEDPSSTLSNAFGLYFTSSGKSFVESLDSASYSTQLSKVTIPSLLVWGQYDFVVPHVVIKDAEVQLRSVYKNEVILPASGHRPAEQDVPFFQNEVTHFIELFR